MNVILKGWLNIFGSWFDFVEKISQCSSLIEILPPLFPTIDFVQQKKEKWTDGSSWSRKVLVFHYFTVLNFVKLWNLKVYLDDSSSSIFIVEKDVGNEDIHQTEIDERSLWYGVNLVELNNFEEPILLGEKSYGTHTSEQLWKKDKKKSKGIFGPCYHKGLKTVILAWTDG